MNTHHTEFIITVPEKQIMTIFGTIDIKYGLNKARHIQAMEDLENMGFIEEGRY